MGEPILEPVNIPVLSGKELFKSEPVTINGMEFKVTCVSMGNPHAVSYVESVDDFPLEQIGSKMETHELFPKRINAEFVEVVDRTTLKMRVWERGAGETLGMWHGCMCCAGSFGVKWHK